MRKLFWLLVLATCPIHLRAQWRVIHTFPVLATTPYTRLSAIQAIYFLTGQLRPRVGFIALEEEDTLFNSGGSLIKTTDGGITWTYSGKRRAFDVCVNSICFKDSLTGWCTSYGNFGKAYKTVDGGETWQVMQGLSCSCYGFLELYYNHSNGLLFAGTEDAGEQAYVSSDEGESWRPLGFLAGLVSFSNDSTGVFDGGLIGGRWPEPFHYSTDGGLTWKKSTFGALAHGSVLGVQGTRTFFVMTDTARLYRSDDGGMDWRKIYQFADSQKLATIMAVFGDLHKLYTQTYKGTYVSTDEGNSWQLDCGPPNCYWSKGHYRKMWVGDSDVYAAEIESPVYGARLWHYSKPDPTNASPYLTSDIRSLPVGGLYSASVRTPRSIRDTTRSFAVRLLIGYDDSTLIPLTQQAVPPWKIESTVVQANAIVLKLSRDTTQPVVADQPMVSLNFRSVLTGKLQSSLTLESSAWDADSNYVDCTSTTSSVSSDTVDYALRLECGDSLYLRAMHDEPLFSIASLYPTPASTRLRLVLARNIDAPVQGELADVTGAIAKQFTLESTDNDIDTSTLPSGVYYLRLSQGGYVVTRRVVIEH